MNLAKTHRLGRLVLVLLLAIAGLMGVDLALDWRAGSDATHLATEALVTALALGGAGSLLRAFLQEARETDRTVVLFRREADRWKGEAETLRTQAAEWRSQAEQWVAGLSAAIDEQFLRWALTQAEREVAMLLLKGLSLKEVAAVRGTEDRTARQQARAVYRKSGLAGRAELSAFFLEDLLVGDP